MTDFQALYPYRFAPRPLALILLLAGMAFPALAQEEAPDKVESIAYGAIEPKAALFVQPETQSEMDDAAWRLVTDLLTAKGYRPDDAADLILTVATQLVPRSGDAGTPGEKGEGNLYSSGGQSLLNPTRPLVTSDRTFRIYLSVHDRKSGLYVWRGSVERGDPGHDPAASLPTMLPALLAHFGENYGTKPE